MSITATEFLESNNVSGLNAKIAAKIALGTGWKRQGAVILTREGFGITMEQGTDPTSIEDISDAVVEAQSTADTAAADATSALASVTSIGDTEFNCDDDADDLTAKFLDVYPEGDRQQFATFLLSKISAGAYTLATPNLGGVGVHWAIVAATDFAHVVTSAIVIRDGSATATYNTMTFAAHVGANIVLGYDFVNDVLFVVSKQNVTLSTV